MSTYGRLKKTADRLIKVYGKPVDLVTITTTGPDYDPTTTEESRDAIAVETGYSLTRRDNSTVHSGDKLGILRADSNAALADKIIINSERYSFIDVEPLEPGPTNILYEFHARR